jgi:hypothetical protein|nr:MAG TPA: hypothetical protein [Bacteriophage sp.]
MKKTYRNKLPKGMEVEHANVSIENGEIIVDIEFKEKFKPKDGDFLVIDGSIFIYNPNSEAIHLGLNGYYAGISNDGSITICNEDGYGFGLRKEKIRYATSEEKSSFLERLEKEYNKKWNPEKKCLEDIYIPKFGDIVKVILDDVNNNSYKRNYMICIYPNKNFSETDGFFTPPFLSLNGRLILDSIGGGSKYCNSIIPASESEKQELFNKLVEVGKRWNPETKQLEDIRWRARKGGKYYTINGALDVVGEFADACPHEDVLYKRGNYFHTPEAAQKVADQIKEIFKNSKAE